MTKIISYTIKEYLCNNICSHSNFPCSDCACKAKAQPPAKMIWVNDSMPCLIWKCGGSH